MFWLPYDAESESVHNGGSYPVLMEFDLRSRVLSMSEQTSRTIANPQGLAGRAAGRRPGVLVRPGAGGRLWIAARPAEAPPRRRKRSGAGGAQPGAPLLSPDGGGARSARARPPRAERGSAIRQIERERQRLGRDLHTGVGQLLAAIRLQLEAVTEQLIDPPAPVRQAFERFPRWSATRSTRCARSPAACIRPNGSA